MEQDLHSQTKLVLGIAPAVVTATTTTGAGVDMTQSGGFESIEWLFFSGSVAIDGDFSIVMQESDDDGSADPYAAVPAADKLGTDDAVTGDADIVNTETSAVRRIGSIGKKRWQRVILTEDSANTTGIVGVLAMLSHPKQKAQADQAT